MSNRYQQGSGPPVAVNERLGSIQPDERTSEPVSLIWKQLILDEILDVAATCSSPGWDDAEALPISLEAVKRACNLIYLAPDSIRPPEIVPSADGEIAFEWRAGRNRILSLMPHGDDLVFAAVLGRRNDRESGCKELAKGWPVRVWELLAEFFPNARSSSISQR